MAAVAVVALRFTPDFNVLIKLIKLIRIYLRDIEGGKVLNNLSRWFIYLDYLFQFYI